ncbi:MAG: thioredoxin fold domain-containing protein [Planctomycetales bacterium]|nr:thioredoxin fold domain-containing protein [Planctomycetales bacterium]
MRFQRFSIGVGLPVIALPLIAVAIMTLVPGDVSGKDMVPGVPDVNQARQISQSTGKLILLHFWADNCPPCRRQEKTVFSERTFAHHVESLYVPVKVHVSQNPELARQFRVERWPTDVIVTADGREVQRMVSPQSEADYARALQQIAWSYRNRPVGASPQFAAQSAMPQSNEPNTSQEANEQLQAMLADRAQQVMAPSLQQPAMAGFGGATLAASPANPGNLYARPEMPAYGNATAMPSTYPAAPSYPGTPGYPGAARPNAEYRQVAANMPSEPQVIQNQFVSSGEASTPAATAAPINSPATPHVPDVPHTPALAGPALTAPGNAYPPAIPQAAGSVPGSTTSPYSNGPPSVAPAPGPSVATSPQTSAYAANLWSQQALVPPANVTSSATPPAAPGMAPGLAPATGAARSVQPPANPSVVQGQPGHHSPSARADLSSVARSQPAPNATPQAASPPNDRLTNLGMDGYCPVAMLEEFRWARGDKRWGARHRGRVYLFHSAEARQKFLAEPDRYSPGLAGYDPVEFAETGRYVEGQREFGVTCNNQMFFFANAASMAKFENAPDRYARLIHQAMGTSESIFR